MPIPMEQHIHESNLIERYDDEAFDAALMCAWKFLIAFNALSGKIICQTQSIATMFQDDLSHDERGQYRKYDVQVNGRVCPKSMLVPDLISNWILDMRRHWKTLTPKEMHIRFELAHPFADGNGRTGRLLMWWHEAKLGLSPTLFLNSEKTKYFYWFR